MLIVMKPHATTEEVEAVAERVRALGLTPHPIPGAQRVAIGVTGNKGGVDPDLFITLPGVAEAIRVSQPFKLVSREVKEEDTVIDVGGVTLGGNTIAVMAGPCSVESRESSSSPQPSTSSSKELGCSAAAPSNRAPAPLRFQGLKEEGLKLLALRARGPG